MMYEQMPVTMNENVNMVHILCSDGACVALDTNSLTTYPPMWARFMGLCEDFAPPELDECGRLTFLSNFQIPRMRFLECLNFLRTGYVRDVLELSETFNILGGCDELDQYYKNQLEKDAEHVAHNQKMFQLRTENPLCPNENIQQTFRFEAHPMNWVHDDTWDVGSVITESPHLFWWRQRLSNEL